MDHPAYSRPKPCSSPKGSGLAGPVRWCLLSTVEAGFRVRAPSGEKAVSAARIVVRTHDLAGVVDSIGLGIVPARHVERGVAALIEQEAVGAAAITVTS